MKIWLYRYGFTVIKYILHRIGKFEYGLSDGWATAIERVKRSLFVCLFVLPTIKFNNNNTSDRGVGRQLGRCVFLPSRQSPWSFRRRTTTMRRSFGTRGVRDGGKKFRELWSFRALGVIWFRKIGSRIFPGLTPPPPPLQVSLFTLKETDETLSPSFWEFRAIFYVVRSLLVYIYIFIYTSKLGGGLNLGICWHIYICIYICMYRRAQFLGRREPRVRRVESEFEFAGSLGRGWNGGVNPK